MLLKGGSMQYFYAFVVGGALCVIAQLMVDLTRITPGKILVLYVTAGVVLGALGLYQPLVDFAGAGASVPLLGFGNSLARGAIKGAAERGVIGAFTGGMTGTAAGVAAAILFGYLAAILFQPRTKK